MSSHRAAQKRRPSTANRWFVGVAALLFAILLDCSGNQQRVKLGWQPVHAVSSPALPARQCQRSSWSCPKESAIPPRTPFLAWRGGAGTCSPQDGQVDTTVPQQPWWNWKKAPAANLSVENQIQALERQIRQIQEEKDLLQRQRQQQPHPSTITAPSSESNSRKQLQQELEQQLQGLLDQKRSLEDLNREQQTQMEELSKSYEQAQARRDELQTSYDRQREKLTAELELQRERRTARDLETPSKDWNETIASAQDQARKQVWQEGQERIDSATSRLTEQFQQELQEQRRTAEAAIEKQRQKMRALAKTMAEREQKHHYEQQQRLMQAKKEQQRQRQLEEERKLAEQKRVARQEEQARLERERVQTPVAPQPPESAPETVKARPSTRDQKPAVSPTAPVVSNESDGARKKPVPRKAANWQRYIPWQPSSLPPTEVVKLTFD